MSAPFEHNASFSPVAPDDSLAERPGTPERPPYSPVTPVLSHLEPLPSGVTSIGPPELGLPEAQTPTESAWNTASRQSGQHGTGSTYARPPPPPMPVKPEPAAVPISESDNPDVIALRSAISVLQLQRQKALQDIRTLDKMKKAALADPEGFAQELVAGRLSSSQPPNSFVDTHLPPDHDGDSDGQEDGDAPASQPASKYGQLPNPQNIVRMPPINWAKYQIVGEPLDRLHEEQRSRPVAGEPRPDPNFQRAPEHFIAAPYRPLTDKLESPAKGRPAKRDKKG